MAANIPCLPSAGCSEISGIPSLNHSIALRTCIHPVRRPLLRITIVAKSPPQAPLNPHHTAGPVPKSAEAQPQNHSTKLFSSTGVFSMPPVPVQKWNLTDQHLLAMTACVAGCAMTAFFVAAIPTLLAFKRAAESLEKLLEVTREELPGTMAAVRLSGMEISDLTMELSDLGQEISSGVKSSARAVRAAQDGFRRMSNVASMAFVQEHATVPVGPMKPAVALVARDLREMLVQVRLIFHSFLTLKYLSGWARKFWNMRKTQSPRNVSNSYSFDMPQK